MVKAKAAGSPPVVASLVSAFISSYFYFSQLTFYFRKSVTKALSESFVGTFSSQTFCMYSHRYAPGRQNAQRRATPRHAAPRPHVS